MKSNDKRKTNQNEVFEYEVVQYIEHFDSNKDIGYATMTGEVNYH